MDTCTLLLCSRCRAELTGFIAGTAGAGSLILEFGTLSRLTGDDRFEKAAYKAFFALWNRKSAIGLVGNTINSWTGVRRCHTIILFTSSSDCICLVLVAS